VRPAARREAAAGRTTVRAADVPRPRPRSPPSPVAGYSSFKGLEYNATPLSLERALFDHVGLRLSPSVAVYDRSVQGYGLLLSVPVYLAARAEGRPYGGLYAAPLVAGLVDRLPTTRTALRAGAEAGWAWTFAERWRCSVGLWSLFKSSGLGASDGGLLLSLGLWL
jgi:hypothetical protein